MMSINLSRFTISKIKNADYCCVIGGIRKNGAISSLVNIDLTGKNRKTIKNKYQE